MVGILLVPGGNLIKGNIELLLHADASTVASKVPHRPTQEWVHSKHQRENEGERERERSQVLLLQKSSHAPLNGRA